MVIGGRDVQLLQFLGYLLTFPSAAHVDDGAARHLAENMHEFLDLVLGRAHHISQVLALKAHAEDVLLAEMQLLLDVVGHLRRCGGSQGQHGCVGFDLAEVGNLEVGGAEVVAPLTDAVGFIDGDEAHLEVVELGKKQLRRQPLGRDIEQFGAAEDAVVQRLDNLAARHARVDGGCLHAFAPQVFHLVFHQGDERSDDDASALLGDGGYLEGDTLAAARGHQPQRVAAGGNALDDG